jgi:hypothetical protein
VAIPIKIDTLTTMDSDGIIIPVFSKQDRGKVMAVANKPLVYLDSNVWIDITEKFPELAEYSRRLVHANKLLFPVSFPIVDEVFQQPTEEKRLRVAELMDELSRGVCFRPSKMIHDLEANLALNVILGTSTPAIQKEQILTWVVEFVGRMVLKFPPSWKQQDADRFHSLIVNRDELRSVKYLAKSLQGNQMRQENAERMKRYVDGMTSSIEKSNSDFRHLAKDVRRKQLLLEERISVVNKLISPNMSKALLKVVGPEKLLDTIAAISKQIGEGGLKRLEQIMKAMPSLDLYCHILAERSCNSSRKVREQDFYDVEHIIVGGAYADFFVTSDGNLFDFLTNRCSISAEKNCCVKKGVEGLKQILNQFSN